MLTQRELEVVRALVLGETVSRIALRLRLRRGTVHRHLSNVYAKTCTWSQAQLAGWCVAHGIVTVDQLREVYADRGVGAAMPAVGGR